MRRVALAIGLATLGLASCGGGSGEVPRGDAAAGAEVYTTHCASCHGPAGQGVADAGPPLVHPLYDESVYPDTEFVRAVRSGATSDAWPFPVMPAVPGLGDEELGDVLAHVRALQGGES